MYAGLNTTVETVGYIGNGAVMASNVNKSSGKPTGGYWNLGIISSAVMAISTDFVEMQDTMSGTMGVAKRQKTKTTVEVTLNLKSVSAENVALGAYSQIVKDAAESNRKFSDIAYKGKAIVPDGIIASVESIKDMASSETLVEGTDYLVSNGHIFFTEDGTIEDGVEVEVTYSTVSTKRLEALINSDLNLCLVFDGFNVGQGKSPVKVTMYNVSISPMSQRQLISTEYGDLELKGTIQLASYVTGSDLSKYYKEEHAD